MVFGCDELVAQWVVEHTGHPISPPYTAIGATRDGFALCAGAVFNDWNGSNIDMTLASERGLSLGAIRAVYNYVFVQLGAQRLSAHTKRSNKVMRDMLQRAGFQYEGLRRRYYGPNKSDDAFLFALYPENARRYHAIIIPAART